MFDLLLISSLTLYTVTAPWNDKQLQSNISFSLCVDGGDTTASVV